nr:aminotransferase class I/II-fold pyridoxal phosphate-dependent enzyme [Treponema sp.]
HEHIVYSNISEEAAWMSVVATSASKTFNLAGLQFSTCFIKNPSLKKKINDERDKTGYDEPSLMGFTATQAAYEKGLEWLIELKQHLKNNLDFVRDYLAKNLPKVHLVEPEGTYLIWLNFNEYGLSDSELDDLIVNKAKVWLDRGTMFGLEGEGYQRINIATPKPLLEEALIRIKNALDAI